MSGRVTTIDVVLSDPDIIYAGTALQVGVEIHQWWYKLVANF